MTHLGSQHASDQQYGEKTRSGGGGGAEEEEGGLLFVWSYCAAYKLPSIVALGRHRPPPPLLLRALSSSVVHLGLLGGSLHLTPSIHVDGLRARHSYDKRLRDELAALVKAQGALALVSADSEGNGGAAELRAAHAALDAAAMIEAQTTDVLAAAAVGGGGGGWAGGGGG